MNILFSAAKSPLIIIATPETVKCGANCKMHQAGHTYADTGLVQQLTEFFSGLFNTGSWPARWHCGTWSDFHGWFYIISDLLIWASYFAIPLLLAKLLKKRIDIPFPKIGWLFVAFILLCGTTHLIDALIFWWPAYRISALIRFFTALVSVTAVYALYKVVPLALNLRTVDELEHEINERKQIERELKKSHELLFQSHQQLKTFTHILSHNIRNHSSNISLLTGLIDTETLDENNADLIDKIVKVSRGLNTTLDDLAEAIKIRENTVPPETVIFRATAGRVVEIMESAIINTGTVIKYDFKVEEVRFPNLYLESILMNLISNSIKYRKKDHPPYIQLRTYKNPSGQIVLECEDNGLGIDLNLHGAKIFGLYKTFHVHDEAHGVGLFLMKTQVESQGGVIRVDSSPGKGAIFTITFK